MVKKIIAISFLFLVSMRCSETSSSKENEEAIPTSKLDALTSLEEESDTVSVMSTDSTENN